MLSSIRRDLPDPKSIVKPIPLPYSSHKGVKIQARTLNVYNAYLPARDDVRQENYTRRMGQMSSMGFQTPNNIPYRIIGHPLYLEQSDIILNGLGQLQQTIQESKKVDSISKKPVEIEEKTKPNQGFSYRSLTGSKQLINLNKQVKKNDDLLKRVRLGASLFEILRNEEENKLKDLVKEREKDGSQMRIRPMIDSDDEILEGDLSDDENLFNDLHNNINSALNTNMSEEKAANQTDSESKTSPGLKILGLDKENSVVSYSSVTNNSVRPQTHTIQRNNSLMPGPSIRRPKTSTKLLKERSKPYAPIYSSLLCTEEITQSDKTSTTRQLCALLWILESMSAEPPNYIGPLRTCFLVNDLGGEKITEKMVLKSKEKEVQWNNFKKHRETKRMKDESHKKLFSKAANRIMSLSHLKTLTKNSIDLADHTHEESTESTSKIEQKRIGTSPEEASYLDEDSSFTYSKFQMVVNNTKKKEFHQILQSNDFSTMSLENTLTESNQDNIIHTLALTANQDTTRDSVSASNFEFLLPKGIALLAKQQNVTDSFLQSITTSSGQDNKTTSKPQVPKPNIKSAKSKSTTHNNTSRSKKEPELLTEHDLELLRIGDDADMERIFNRSNGGKQERKNSLSLKALTGPIHAVWTQKVIDYQNNLPSVKKRQNLIEIKNQFNNVMDEKTIDIHKKLEQILKKRIQNCMVKYSAMNPNERGLHKMLNAMKNELILHQRYEDSENAAAQMVYYQWFLDVEALVDKIYSRNDMVLCKLLDKLSYHGKLTTRKKNEALFFRILDTLKLWELLSPDIMSAVEFCREKILEISEDDFEDWFRAKTQKKPELFVSRKRDVDLLAGISVNKKVEFS